MDETTIQAVAKAWSVKAELLRETDWKITEVHGNGEQHGHFVTFSAETDPEILIQLTIYPGEYTRGLPRGTFDSVKPERQEMNLAELKNELLSRIQKLEAALKTYQDATPARNHNNPPELIEADPIPRSEFTLLTEMIKELKLEVQLARPEIAKLEKASNTFLRVAKGIILWLGKKADVAIESGVKWGAPIGVAWAAAHPETVFSCLTIAADATTSLAQALIQLL